MNVKTKLQHCMNHIVKPPPRLIGIWKDKVTMVDTKIESKQLFDFATDWLLSNGLYHCDFSNYALSDTSKLISICYYTNRVGVGITLLDEYEVNRSTEIELNNEEDIEKLLSILLFSIREYTNE